MRMLFLVTIFVCSLFGLNRTFLAPEVAFVPEITLKEDQVVAKVKLADTIYLYRDSLKLGVEGSELILEDVTYAPSHDHDGVEVYSQEASITARLAKKSGDVKDVMFTLAYQGCSQKGLCYEPNEWKTTLGVDAGKLSFAGAQSAAAAPQELSSTDAIAQTLMGGSLGLILLSFFGFGLLLAMTPCVFPMIPILSSIIVSQGEGMNAKRGFMLSLVYVLAMSAAYTIAGVIAGLFGANLQASLQNPWVLSAFAAIFVALAFSMFGFYEIGLPASWQSRLAKSSDGASKKGGFIGVGIMGFLSALIVGPCVAPPLAGALIYIGQSGDALLGGAALFVMSLGMGAPLLLVGIGAGKYMPRPGGWMNNVSKVFGVIMLMIALWMLSRILPSSVSMMLWALLFVVSSVYLGAFESLKDGIHGLHTFKKRDRYLLVHDRSLFVARGAQRCDESFGTV